VVGLVLQSAALTALLTAPISLRPPKTALQRPRNKCGNPSLRSIAK
jgi:hypothetical protein